MDKLNEKKVDFDQIMKEEEVEWWRPTKEDNFNISNKLLRVGCRQLKRKLLRCTRYEEQEYSECHV